jgi:hypothetical protein
MRIGILLRIGLSVMFSALLASAQTQSQAKSVNLQSIARITVDVSKPLAFKIPPTIFGTFLEPIGNSTYRRALGGCANQPEL